MQTLLHKEPKDRKRFRPTLFILLVLFIFTALSSISFANASNTIERASPSTSVETGTQEAVTRAIVSERNLLKPPELTDKDYRKIGPFKSRTAAWFLAQMHLWFAAFVLAIPIFVVILEAIGILKGSAYGIEAGLKYDRTAREFLRVSMTAFTLTMISGVVFAASLFLFYPGLMKYMSAIFKPTYVFYLLFILLENAVLLTYYYGWKRMGFGRMKKIHLSFGILLNIMGTLIMITAGAWATFMMTPGGVDMAGIYSGNIWEAINNPLWHPMNLHRFVANIAYGGSIVAAYAAYRYLICKTKEEKAHYDWMGYTASCIAVIALLPLPFAGYWLTAEIYAYSQQMGITLMGGIFGWAFVVQAVIIGALFLAVNYYLWCGLESRPEGDRYRPYIKYLGLILCLSFLVWFTPHTPVLTPSESAALGGLYHPVLGPLGLMPAKNIAVNFIIIATFVSFLLFRRSERISTDRASRAWAVEMAIIVAGSLNILFLGIYYGYYTDSVYKVASSVPQVMTTLIVIISCSLIEYYAYKNNPRSGAARFGTMPERSQYALIMLAVSFTWLMGLMGYVRAALKRHWHIYSVVRDNSPDAGTPGIADATFLVSIATVCFLGILIFIFWLNRQPQKSADSSNFKEEGCGS